MYEFQINHEKFGVLIFFDDLCKKKYVDYFEPKRIILNSEFRSVFYIRQNQTN